MTEKTCPVTQLIQNLEQVLASGRLYDAKNYRRCEEILALLNDVAWGRAGQDHLPAILHLADEMVQADAPDTGTETGRQVLDALDSAAEVFQSHIETHNCATGDCVRLAPAPCQMTCPAGIDVPTYVSLIGEGRDADGPVADRTGRDRRIFGKLGRQLAVQLRVFLVFRIRRGDRPGTCLRR